jgi:2-oxoglutarate ferredoxin oxidoreductase subunit alpha
MFPAHGDVKLPIIAPGTVEECFYAAIHAVNWAERYQGPVILLSEHALSERNQNIPKPDLSDIHVEKRKVYDGTNGYHRYEGWELSPMPIPGNPGSYVANGSEHDGMGDTTHLPERHIQMTNRRFSKIKLLEDGTYESCNTSGLIAFMPWGGSKGPAQEAYDKLILSHEGLAWYYTMFLNPLPPKLLEELRTKSLVIVPELNFLGQFSSILRSYGVKAESITQITGLPFKVRDLISKVEEMVRQLEKERVTV